MKYFLALLFCVVFCDFGSIAQAIGSEIDSAVESVDVSDVFPDFVESFIKEYGLSCIGGLSTNQMTVSNFVAEDKSVRLDVTTLKCNHPQQDTVFNHIVFNVNKAVSTNSGSFSEISDVDFSAEFLDQEGISHQVFGFVLQSSVQVWDFFGEAEDVGLFEKIRPLINKQRYVEALDAGNVSMGHRGRQSYDYAQWLIENGELKEAVDVLGNHLKTTSFDYEAHCDFFSHTLDSVAASNSAGIVYRNAKDQELVGKAADFLGKRKTSLDDFPVLEDGEKGLQLILIPLSPCNPWLLESSADIFKEITGVPTKVCQLASDWAWGTPDRVYRQRNIQEMLARMTENPIDFEGWGKDRYIDELESIIDANDARSEYYIKQWIKMVEEEPGQYLVDQYLSRLSALLAQDRSADLRTMYVGITEANIYSGDNGYVFSQGYTEGDSRVSVFSYYMMMGVQSRSRLVERIGKELVPAAFKQLGIERSIDPNCPYSYANGVGRLDQKTKTLSAPVREALNKLR